MQSGRFQADLDLHFETVCTRSAPLGGHAYARTSDTESWYIDGVQRTWQCLYTAPQPLNSPQEVQAVMTDTSEQNSCRAFVDELVCIRL